MSGTTISSKASASGHKVSMFSTKSGFVIPKNKLSGSLVPIFRRGEKLDGSDASSGESVKQTQRKTKWGPDLTNDAAVRRGRALAYQTRVDQITQQLKCGVLEVEDDHDLPLAAENAELESSAHHIGNEKLELELEKREAIGEILKLNPRYKAPSDYKPLLKEARVPIPVKDYPGYNFVGLIFGPGGDNQKRLEKETGATIHVYGVEVETKEKVQINPTDDKEIQGLYEELYFHLLADSFEKVDAAVSVIELLITSVSENLAAASTTSNSASTDNVNVPNQDAAEVNVVSGSMVQPAAGPTQTSPQGQFQSPGSLPNTMYPPGFIVPPNSSVPVLNSPVHLLTSSFRPSNMPSLYGPPPVTLAGFDSSVPNTSLALPKPYPPLQVPQHPSMAHTNSALNGSPGNPFRMASPQPPQISSFSSMPIMGSLLLPRSSPQQGSLPDQIRNPAGSSTVWLSRAPPITPASAGVSNMAHMLPTVAHSQRPHPVSFPSGESTQSFNASINRPTGFPGFSSVLQSQMGFAPGPGPGPGTIPSTVQSLSFSTTMHSGILGSGNVSIFAPAKPPMVMVPSSGGFTFQPHQPQAVPESMPRLSNQSAMPNPPSIVPIWRTPASQAPSFQFPDPNLSSRPVSQLLSRPESGNYINQPRPNISSIPFARNPSVISLPPRLPTFADASPVAPRTSSLHMGPRNFSPAPQIPTYSSSLPPRPGNYVQPGDNYRPQTHWPENLLSSKQRVMNNLSTSGKSSSSPREQQLYDPFSPT